MKNNYILFFTIFILISCSDDTTAPTAEKGTIKGFVYNLSTNERIPDALISTEPLTSSMKTNSNGDFQLQEIDPGNYILIVSKEGYETYRNEIKVSDKITNDLQIPLESLSDKNTPPVKPILTYPSNNVVVELESINFRWNSSDLDNDVLTYDFYLSKESESLKLVASDLSSSTFQNITAFEDGTTYQWQVVVKDKYSSVSSVINKFMYKKSDIGNIDNLIGYWKLDDNPLDSGPNGYNGLQEGVTYVSNRKGVSNSAANFNGIPGLSKSLVSCSNKIQFSEIFSVSFWLKPANSLGSNSDSFYDCISKWGGSTFEAASLSIGITNNSELYLNSYDQQGNKKLFKSGIDIPIGSWTNVIVTFQNGFATFYINGDFVLTSADFPIPQYSTVPFSIGARHDNLSAYHGAIDDVLVYSRILTNQEIKDLAK